MADNRKYAQLQPFSLAGSGVVSTATTIVLTSFQDIDGNDLSMSAFGTKGYGTLEPGSSDKEEQFSFTGITQNSNGTATLTGVSHVEFLYPYTETSGLTKAHAGGTTMVISNTSGFYNEFANKQDDETIVGLWQFPNDASTPIIGASYVAPTIDNQVASKKYVDDVAVAGAPDANETTKGIIQIATNAQMGTATQFGSTGAWLVPPNNQLTAVSAGAGSANKLVTLDAAGTFDATTIKNASTTVRGQSELATNAETAAGTVSGGTGAALVPANSTFKTASSATISNDSNVVPVTSTSGVLDQSFLATAQTSGESISIGHGVYINDSDSKVYKTLGTGDESTFSFTGIAVTAAGAADATVRIARPGQIATGLTGLSAGAYYYITDVAGVLGTTPGTRYAKVGQALTTTTMRVIEPKFVVRGSQNITSATTFAQTTGFYPAHIEVRAGGSNVASRIMGISVGTNANNCVYSTPGTGVSNIASFDAALAFRVQDDANAAARYSGTITALTATGFTLNCTTFNSGGTIYWTAYSE